MSSLFLILIQVFLPLITSLSDEIVNLSNYSYPKPIITPSIESIAIITTNDIHGHILPTTTYFPGSTQTLRSGGVNLLSTYIKTIAQDWGSNTLWLDSGDQFQGTLESNMFLGEPIVKFFNWMNFTNRMAAAVGNHDFDFGFENMSKVFGLADFPYLSANLYNRSSKLYWDQTNVQKSQMFHIGSLNIGVIGLTTTQTPFTTAFNVSDVEFKEYRKITMEESLKLKKMGADIVLLVCHIGMFCTNGTRFELAKLLIRNKNTIQNTKCTPSDELHSFVNKLPKGVIDAVIGGHTHTIVHHWVNDIPIIIGDMYARHFNILYLTYDKINKQLITNMTEIEGPVPVCETLYPNERTCYDDNTQTGYFNYTNDMVFKNFSFHGKIIEEDLDLKEHLNVYFDQVNKLTSEKIAYIERPMEITKKTESSLGNFVSDAMQKATNAELVILNRGVIRRNWDEGELTYNVLFETIPINNYVVTFEMTGHEFIETMKIIQRGSMGYYSTTGVQQIICKDKRTLLDIRLINKTDIQLDRIYTIATTNFMVYGGDDFHEVISYYTPKNIQNFTILRDIVYNYALEENILNSEEKSCIREGEPRLLFVPKCDYVMNEAIRDIKMVME